MYLDLERLKRELAAERRKIEIARRLLKVMILRSKSELDFFYPRHRSLLPTSASTRLSTRPPKFLAKCQSP